VNMVACQVAHSLFNIPTKINRGQIEMVSRVHLIRTGDKVEESQAALFGGARVVGEVQGEAQVDDGDVDAVGLDDLAGLLAGVGAEGGDAHGLEERGEAVGP